MEIDSLMKAWSKLKDCVSKKCAKEKSEYWGMSYNARKKYTATYKASIEKKCTSAVKNFNVAIVKNAKLAVKDAPATKQDKARRELVKAQNNLKRGLVGNVSSL